MHYIPRQRAILRAFNYRKGRRVFFADGFNLTRTTDPIEGGLLECKVCYTQIATPKNDRWIKW